MEGISLRRSSVGINSDPRFAQVHCSPSIEESPRLDCYMRSAGAEQNQLPLSGKSWQNALKWGSTHTGESTIALPNPNTVLDRKALRACTPFGRAFTDEELDMLVALQVRSGDTIFKTEKGSLYKMTPDGYSTRFKAAGALSYLPEDTAGRLQPACNRVLFVSAEIYRDLGRKLDEGFLYHDLEFKEELGITPHLVFAPECNAWDLIQWQRKDGTSDIFRVYENIIPYFETSPAVGLYPLELNQAKASSGIIYSAQKPHLGHQITELGQIP